MRTLRHTLPLLLTLLLLACGPRMHTSTAPEGLHPSPTAPQPTATATGIPTATPTNLPTGTPAPTSTSLPTLTPQPSSVTLMAVGDLMLARTVGERILAEGPEVVFDQVWTILSAADILAGNLECALTDQGDAQDKAFTFAAPPLSAQALGLVGFDIAVLGNNHSLDYGQAGLAQTMQLLAEQGIAPLGVGLGQAAAGPLIIEKNGLRLAFLSYVNLVPEYTGFDARTWRATQEQVGIAWAETAIIQEDVRAAKALADLVIVFMHFGYEGSPLAVVYQRELAVAAIDAGATAVLGSHPHVLQSVDEYHGGLIAYSLGNFVFDEYGMPENRSAILRLRLDQDGIVFYDWFPVVLVDGLPQIANPEQSAEILRILAP